jgi:hypothetical protein
MTTSEPHGPARAPQRTLSDHRFLLACTFGLLAVGALVLAFTLAGEVDTAAGALVGGVGVLALAAAVRWRARRRGPAADDGLGRTLLGTGDERDKAILTSSLSWVGVAALLINAVGLAAVALGADASSVIGIIEAALLAVLVTAFLVLSRRL